MASFIAKRLLWGVPVILLVAVAVFAILHIAPGDPARLIAGEDASQETVELIRAKMGLDRPLYIQFIQYLGRLVRGDLGHSLHSGIPVRDELLSRLSATFELALAAIAIAILIGVPLGFIAAIRYRSAVDFANSILATILMSAPGFWIGLVLMVVFAVILGWLPSAGRGTWQHLILPAVTASGQSLAVITRMTRSEVLDVLGEDYVRTARAKGLSELVVLGKHVLKNALVGIITVIGIQFGALLGGTVVVEVVFGWPGIGRMVVDAIYLRDFPIVQAGLLLSALFFVFLNLLVDLAYALVDPRIRYDADPSD